MSFWKKAAGIHYGGGVKGPIELAEAIHELDPLHKGDPFYHSAKAVNDALDKNEDNIWKYDMLLNKAAKEVSEEEQIDQSNAAINSANYMDTNTQYGTFSSGYNPSGVSITGVTGEDPITGTYEGVEAISPIVSESAADYLQTLSNQTSNQTTQNYARGGAVNKLGGTGKNMGARTPQARQPMPPMGGSPMAPQRFAAGGAVAPPMPAPPPEAPMPPMPGDMGGGMGGGMGAGEMPLEAPIEPSDSLLAKGSGEGADMSATSSGLDMVMSSVGDQLAPEEAAQLEEAFIQYPVLDKVMSMTQMNMDGMVNGPGGPTSDDIPARLSDGEFVFTAKAVEQIGVDKLQKMMEDAEMKADKSMNGMPTDANYKCGGLVKRKH